MQDTIARLLSRADVVPGPPTPPGDIAALADLMGAELPPALVELWAAADGVSLDTLDAHLLGPSEALMSIKEWGDVSYPAGSGFLPLLDDHQSNYMGLLARGPLAPRVMHLSHDIGSRLLYRDLASFLLVLLDALDQGDFPGSNFHEAWGDYPPDSPRTLADQAAARALLATDGGHDEWNLAVQLLDASNLAEWAFLLETDHFIRRDAVERMQKMSDPAIRELLDRDRLAFEEFATMAAEAARTAGFKVRQERGDALQVGGKWMNLDVFFHRRRIPDAAPRMLAWFEDLLAGRNPHDRPGHFMAD